MGNNYMGIIGNMGPLGGSVNCTTLVSCYCAWQQAEAERHKTFDTILELDQVGLVLTGRGCADLNMG